MTICLSVFTGFLKSLTVLLLLVGQYQTFGQVTLRLTDIPVRDPFILADEQTGQYYLYAQMSNRRSGPDAPRGVEVYTSRDLTNWTGPTPVFTAGNGFWATKAVWAPEVHRYDNKYYLFVTFTGADSVGRETRGTQILVADAPTGPFKPFRNGPHTPADWLALDGTLWVEDKTPYMIFCYEWLQVGDGTMEVVPLSADLLKLAGQPQTLFKASDAPWVKSLRQAGIKVEKDGYVTDGPFLYRAKTGKLLMIWSSFGTQQYAIGLAESVSGKLYGPWKQRPDPLFRADGGHGMIFCTFDGALKLVFHQTNGGNLERARLYDLEDMGDGLRLKEWGSIYSGANL